MLCFCLCPPMENLVKRPGASPETRWDTLLCRISRTTWVASLIDRLAYYHLNSLILPTWLLTIYYTVHRGFLLFTSLSVYLLLFSDKTTWFRRENTTLVSLTLSRRYPFRGFFFIVARRDKQERGTHSLERCSRTPTQRKRSANSSPPPVTRGTAEELGPEL